jgi:hypothetical protein
MDLQNNGTAMATGPVKRADRCVSDDLEHHIPLFIRIKGDD